MDKIGKTVVFKFEAMDINLWEKKTNEVSHTLPRESFQAAAYGGKT